MKPVTSSATPSGLLDLVGEIQDACWPIDGKPGDGYLPPRFLFHDGLTVHPIPFFGNLSDAEVITVAVNPSSTEFAAWRGWTEERLSPEILSSRLLGYFNSDSPKPHPWFAEIEEALNIIDCSYLKNAAHLDLSPRATRSMRTFQTPRERADFLEMLRHDIEWLGDVLRFASRVRLVIFVGRVIHEDRDEGIGVGAFVSQHAQRVWSDLQGRRWPHSPCSKRQLAERVYRKRRILADRVCGRDPIGHA